MLGIDTLKCGSFSSSEENSALGIISKERWDGIIKCNQRFLYDATFSLYDCPYISKEVADSWIRSRELGVDPDVWVMEHKLSDEEFREIQEVNRTLLEVARPLFKHYQNLMAGYHMTLIDNNGVVLLFEGQVSSDYGLERFGGEGLCWSEENVGTTSFLLAQKLKYPVQLLGAEYYSSSFHEVLTSSVAPIMDQNGEVLATLTLVHRPKRIVWDDYIKTKYPRNDLALITSLAMAIETQVKLRDSYQQLEVLNDKLYFINGLLQTTNDTLDTTLAGIGEAIVAIDNVGKIVNINQEGARVLHLSNRKNRGHNIQDFLNEDCRLMEIVAAKEKAIIEGTLLSDATEKSYMIHVWPIVDSRSSVIEGAILKFTAEESINKLVNKRTGATAIYRFEDIIGESLEIKKAIKFGQLFAASPENILLTGESGTGKEMFAQSIHNISTPRGPFIVVNCAAMPRSLIESELFGYEGGSFTGADRSGRPGKIELANGGTLFLDEIGDMPFEVQAILLRVLQDKQVMRIGGSRYKRVNFRVVAATNKNLYKMVKENLFREDLFFRLSVLCIKLPALRHRDQDALLFSRYFIENYCHKLGWPVPELSPQVLDRINEYSWPGNVRELENALIYAVNACQGELIELEHLPNTVINDESYHNGQIDLNATSFKDYEINAIKSALVRSNNNIPKAAVLLKVSKSTLYRKMREYDMEF
ncbi:MAG: sigma 54-interacting transcriptional regulator [Syntrophomonadaceae bacterium]|nr:sigma 54-interacting transcriptional regulator [Syntrophomonadaceae bacterium]